MKHILVTTDFSEGSESAFAYAKEQLQLMGKEKAKITLLKIIDVLGQANITFEYGLAISDKKGLLEKLQRQASEKMKELAKKHFPGLSIETVVVKPKKAVYQEIIGFAKENNVDLIVISTHGRTGVQHLLMGSVAERIVRLSPCPVLVIPRS
ncbi:MAG: universal stress protein [Candidatus Scalindua sp. AMX11]|nr:MAG: universal stress protein [Candidatus Scalindua sp.]NOG83460.1 universal stress protein [Planctomycetota bacterium]RZV72924.1 MAG: universal stress protein [Candidatus Scalindua sp. SCAELEC01]TDE64779.1 MAG: universal stress protein [Candidatus Scalindua sp. AMX11]GJQ59839.1 MAG: universal stress protein [Candidatus Scalindua sp.]